MKLFFAFNENNGSVTTCFPVMPSNNQSMRDRCVPECWRCQELSNSVVIDVSLRYCCMCSKFCYWHGNDPLNFFYVRGPYQLPEVLCQENTRWNTKQRWELDGRLQYSPTIQILRLMPVSFVPVILVCRYLLINGHLNPQKTAQSTQSW